YAVARYVMANRRAGKFRETDKSIAREAIDRTMAVLAGSVSVVADSSPADPLARRVVVFDADPRNIKAPSPHPDVLIEPEIIHWTDVIAPADFVGGRLARRAAPVAVAAGVSLQASVRGNGQPLTGAAVHLFLRGFGGSDRELVEVTDNNGEVAFSYDSFWQAAAMVVLPAGEFWSVVVRGPSGKNVVDCPVLPQG